MEEQFMYKNSMEEQLAEQKGRTGVMKKGQHPIFLSASLSLSSALFCFALPSRLLQSPSLILALAQLDE